MLVNSPKTAANAVMVGQWNPSFLSLQQMVFLKIKWPDGTLALKQACLGVKWEVRLGCVSTNQITALLR